MNQGVTRFPSDLTAQNTWNERNPAWDECKNNNESKE